jgi:hypothetical protein
MGEGISSLLPLGIKEADFKNGFSFCKNGKLPEASGPYSLTESCTKLIGPATV